MTSSVPTSNGARGHYAPVNGLRLYHEIHGEGAPLVLIHGGLGSAAMFADLLPGLARGRRVVAVDLQAHGRTADIDRPPRYETMADDIAALVGHLRLGQADVMGYSLGGGVALQTAIRHPEVVGRLVVVSAPFRRNAWFPEVRAGMAQVGPEAAEAMKAGPLYGLYVAAAPRPQDWPVLLTKVGDLLRQDYDWTEGVASIQVPTLIAAGDADSFSPAHAAELFGLLGGGQRDPGWDGTGGRSPHRLAILPGATHYDSLRAPALVPAVTAFLDVPGG